MTLAPVSGSPLDVLSQARVLLDTATSVDEVKGVRDKAEALRSYAKQAGEGLELQNRCAELKLRAERRAGEMLGESEVGPGIKSVTLTDFGVSANQSSRWQKLATLPESDFEAYIARAFNDSRELTTAGALQLARVAKAHDPDERPALHLVDGDGGLPGLSRVFPTLVADPPWQYDNRATRNAAEKHYPTLTVDELCDLDVEPHAATASHLYLWTTNAFLRDAFSVMEAWGFTYKAHLAWVKPQMGMGNYFRISHEHVLFGIRGQLATARNDVTSWFSAPRGKHSKKPESFYDLVESCSPSPYLELFARTRRMGWTGWGNEA